MAAQSPLDSADARTSRWFIAHRNQRQGPMSWSRLVTLASRGDLDPDATLAKVKELFGGIKSKKLPKRPDVRLQSVKTQSLTLKTDLPYSLHVIAFLGQFASPHHTRRGRKDYMPHAADTLLFGWYESRTRVEDCMPFVLMCLGGSSREGIGGFAGYAIGG